MGAGKLTQYKEDSMTVVYVVLLLAVALLSAYIGRKSAPAPVVLLPAPKHFGLKEAEAVKGSLGGLSPLQAQAAQVAAAVTGMEYTVPDDVKELRTNLAVVVSSEKEKIEEFADAITRAKGKIQWTQARDAEVADLAAAFGV